QWQRQIKEEQERQLLTGLAGSAKTLAIASTYQTFQRPILLVVPNLYYMNQLADDLRNVCEDVFVYPVDEMLSAEMAFASPEARVDRINTLNAIAAEQPGIYVVPLAALRKYLPMPETWRNAQFHWQIGSELDLNELPQQLVLMGYERQQMIMKPGEFS